MFSQGFWEIKVLIQKKYSNWCLFQQTSFENSSDILTPIYENRLYFSQQVYFEQTSK